MRQLFMAINKMMIFGKSKKITGKNEKYCIVFLKSFMDIKTCSFSIGEP